MLLNSLKSAAWALAPALAMAVATPAAARDGRYYDRRGGDDDAAIAIGAGVVGLALGAAIASSGRDRGYYYDDGYYYDGPRGYYGRPYPRYYRYEYRAYPRHYRRGWRHDGWRGDGWGRRDRRWRY